MYPNPVSENINFEIDFALKGDLKITMFDATGRLVLKNSYRIEEPGMKVVSVNVDRLKSGLYTSCISYSNKTVMKIFFKI